MASALKNLSHYDDTNIPSAKDMSFGIVVSDWNEHITHTLYAGCLETLKKHGADEDKIFIAQVPGFLCAVGLLLAVGCSKRHEAEPFPNEDTYVRIYSDILIEERRVEILHQDPALLMNWKDSLFARNGMNPKEYEEVIAQRKAGLENWKEFNQRVARRLEELQREISVGKDTVKHIPRSEVPPRNLTPPGKIR